MVLYHATHIDNADSIRENGINPNATDKISNSKERLLDVGVFGFVSLDDAVMFIKDNNWHDEYAIFEFEVSEIDLINDPEYDGEAKFYKTNNSVEIKKEILID